MEFLLDGIRAFTWQQAVMFAVGFTLIWLAIKKQCEPMLLLPMGFGAILVNIPSSGALNQFLPGVGETHGAIQWLFKVGIESSEILPLLLFIGIGAMIDFSPLFQRPIYFVFAAAAHFGIFATIVLACMLGFDLRDATAIGIIGAADGPTTILVSQVLQSKYMGAIAVTAYSYMALVPIVQPGVIYLLTSREERRIRMEPTRDSDIPRSVRILFPIAVTIVVGLIAPAAVSLIGFLMFGNLVRECGVLESLSKTAQSELTNLITLLLGIIIAFTLKASEFVTKDTVMILGLGLFAFVCDTAAGLLFAKFLNLFLRKKINPMIGAAGISAFPMSARVIHKLALKEDPGNFLIMQAVSANVAGQIASVAASGLVLSLVLKYLQ